MTCTAVVTYNMKDDNGSIIEIYGETQKYVALGLSRDRKMVLYCFQFHVLNGRWIDFEFIHEMAEINLIFGITGTRFSS